MRKLSIKFLEKLKDRCFKDLGQADPVRHKKQLSRTHWLALPNVRTFQIRIKDNNSLHEWLGIDKRNRPDFEWTAYRNKPYNLYMIRQIKRLRKFKHEPEKFFKIMKHLLIHSKVFRVSAINKTLKNWYKTMPLSTVLQINRKVDSIFKTSSTKLDYKRVYIPKSENRHRPLGVPTPEWRIALQMINNFLHIFLEDKFNPNQHGFLPGKGTLTAWIEVLKKCDQYSYIYEYDLRNYFEEIDLSMLKIYLKLFKIPHNWVNWIHSLNSCTPKLPSEPLMSETSVHRKALDREGQDFFTRMDDKVPNTPFNQLALKHMADIFTLPKPLKGVPQGSNLSPLLSLIPLINFLNQADCVSYADDGLFFCNEKKRIYDEEPLGIEFNIMKTKWVKQDGKWIRPIKFLGLEYDGTTLKANTRNGGTLVANDKQEAFSLLNQLDIKYGEEARMHSWSSILDSKWGGFLQSKLFNNSWEPRNFDQNFIYKLWLHPPKSWSSRFHSLEHNIFNAGSFSSHSLIKILTNQNRTSYKRLNLR